MNDKNLKHFGVLGMRWGIRRGIGSRASGKSSNKRVASKRSDDFKKVAALKKKRVEEMSNEELSTVIKRMDLQKRYKDLNPSRGAKGKKAAKEILSVIGQVSGGIAGMTALAAVGGSLYKKVKKVSSSG